LCRQISKGTNGLAGFYRNFPEGCKICSVFTQPLLHFSEQPPVFQIQGKQGIIRIEES